MEKTVYNPQKGRLETINIDFTDENTTWFDDHEKIEEVYMITDFEGGLVIAGCNYDYPILVYDISRSDINYDIKKGVGFAKDIHRDLVNNLAHRQANAVALPNYPLDR